MGIFELFLLAVGLSMDAFAVSVCKGLSAGRVTLPHALTAGLWFGGFQGLMPFLGWLLGSRFQVLIANIDHWIAFLLLGLIGLNHDPGVPQPGGGEPGDLLFPPGHAPVGGGHQYRRPHCGASPSPSSR